MELALFSYYPGQTRVFFEKYFNLKKTDQNLKNTATIIKIQSDATCFRLFWLEVFYKGVLKCDD